MHSLTMHACMYSLIMCTLIYIGDDVSVNFDEEKTIDTVLQNTTSEIEIGKSAAISQGI